MANTDLVTKADFLFAGAGLSGLTLVLEMVQQPFFQDKTWILIDRDDKNRNDRTWCFWATEQEPLPPIVHKTWEKCLFFGENMDKTLDIAPYQYHMVRGLDFYQWAFETLSKYPQVKRVKAQILEIDAQTGRVHTDVGVFEGDRIFNSAQYSLENKPYSVDGARWTAQSVQPSLSSDSPYTFLLQHFKGWIIESSTPAFDPQAVTFMDYRLEQHDETRFVYVLPLSETRALVEFTVFSPSLCAPETYNAELKRYVSEVLNIQDYQVLEEEFGVIPMTDMPLPVRSGGRIWNIGTAGGMVKASSGYAFLRTQRMIRSFVADWVQKGLPNAHKLRSSPLFQAMDSIMLRVLREGTVSGKTFFSRLFQKLPARVVFRFLDEDATGGEVFRILSASPTWPFFRSALRQIPILWSIFRSKNA